MRDSYARLDACYAAFRASFGPDVLGNLDGEALFTTLHGGVAADGLNYWMEFKNDEDFPNRFGSITGGSAFKFGMFFSQDRAAWITGSPSKPEELTLPQAIEIARVHRDELCLSVQVLSEFPTSPAASEARFRRYRANPDEQLRVKLRHVRAAQIQQLFTRLEQLDFDTFNRDIWVFESKSLGSGPRELKTYLSAWNFLCLPAPLAAAFTSVCSVTKAASSATAAAHAKKPDGTTHSRTAPTQAARR